MKKFIVAVMVLAFCAGLQGKEFVIKNALVYDMLGEKALSAHDVWVLDGVIKAVGESLEVPDSVEVIDAAGKPLTPGFMVGASQLGLVEIDLSETTHDYLAQNSHLGAAFSIAESINPRSTLIPNNRYWGLTRAVVIPQASHHVIAGRGSIIHLGSGFELVSHANTLLVVNLDIRGAGIAGGSTAAALQSFELALTDALDFKSKKDELELDEISAYSVSMADLKALDPFISGSKPIMFEVHRASDILAVLKLAKRFGFKAIIKGGKEAWMVADELAAAKVPVVFDPVDNIPQTFRQLAARLEQAKILQEKGVLFAFMGQEIQFNHNAHLIRQGAGNAVAYGLTKLQALKALTINAAKIFGIDNDYGTISPGKVADLVLWNADPLEVTSYVEALFINGKPMSLESRATKLRERYRDLKQYRKAIYKN